MTPRPAKRTLPKPTLRATALAAVRKHASALRALAAYDKRRAT